jgi:hypothetical protein
VDGVDVDESLPWDLDSTWTEYREMIQARRDIPSPAAMDMMVEFGAKNDTGTVHIEVVATDTIPFTDLHLRMAITEDDISTKATYDAVLRAYVPNASGISFAMAEGDTFNHSQEFVIDTAWAAENCKLVAFVQDDDSLEVLQAIQDFVVTPDPAAVSGLTATLSGDDLLLEWPPVTENTAGQGVTVDSYYVYRDTVATFGSGATPIDATADTFYLDDTGVVGDTGTHFYYSVSAVAGGKESALSGAVGEFDISIVSD